MKANDFTLCRVKRDNLIKINVISETEQDKISDDAFDIIVESNSTILVLKENLNAALNKHFCNNMTYLQVRNATG